MKKPLSEEAKTKIETFLKEVIDWFCDHPSEARINFVVGAHSSIIEIHPHPDDVGAMIGRDGVVASGIRMLLGAYSRVINHKLHPQIIEIGPIKKKRRYSRKEQVG